MSVVTAEHLREDLADVISETADFRRRKAEQHPEDGRNERSARWLEAAVEYVESLPDNAPELKPFKDFAHELDEWRGLDDDDEDGRPVILTFFADDDDSFDVAWFGFDNGTGTPTERDFKRLLDDMHSTLLESWRVALWFDAEIPGSMQPPRSFVQYFEGCGVPLFKEDESMPLSSSVRRTLWRTT